MTTGNNAVEEAIFQGGTYGGFCGLWPGPNFPTKRCYTKLGPTKAIQFGKKNQTTLAMDYARIRKMGKSTIALYAQVAPVMMHRARGRVGGRLAPRWGLCFHSQMQMTHR